jgi:hypothetical protein
MVQHGIIVSHNIFINPVFSFYSVSEILPADNGGFELLGYEPKHACNQTINVSGKKTRVSFSFPTDSSIQANI